MALHFTLPTRADSGHSTEHTFRLHRQGMSPEAIAEARGLTAKTIYAHLARLVEQGRVPGAEVLSAALADEIERAYGELAFPKTPEQVAALLPRPVPCELVAYALKARGLKLGGGGRLVSAEIAQAARVLQMAMSQSALQPYPLVRLLQGRKLPTDREKQLFGLFWGHDGDQLLEIVAELSERRRRRLEVAS